MCQLNVYLVPKTVEKNKVVEILNKAFEATVSECITDENIVEGYDNYNTYICAGMRCNCGSIMCFLQNRKKYICWESVKEESIKNKLEELCAIRNLLEKQDYKEKFDKISKKQKELFEKYNKIGEDIGKIETKLVGEVEERKDLTNEEKRKLLHEDVYPKVHQLIMERENLPERKKAFKMYQDFCKKNKLIISSGFYSLTKPESPTTKEIVVKEDGTKEEIEYLNFSNCIYDIIENTKNNTFKNEEHEFENIKKVVKDILEFCEDIKILSFWQSGSEVFVKNKIVCKIDDFSIEKIAYLKFNEMLSIKK